MNIFVVVVTVVVLGAVVTWLIRQLPEPPVLMTEDQLKAEGLSPAKIRAELRHQRAEFRAHANTRAHAVRAGTRVANLTIRLMRGKR